MQRKMPLKRQVMVLSMLAVSITAQSHAVPNLRAQGEKAEWRYITDVEGKRVRLVGPRFLPDPRRRMKFPGRN